VEPEPETGTVINYGSGTGTRFKIIYLIEKFAFYGLDIELEPEPELF
jgi:hypothetical protein